MTSTRQDEAADPSADTLQATERTKLKRFPGRGAFDKATIHAILDKVPLAHVGFANPRPAVLPMVFWRGGDHVYFHGFSKNRMLGELRRGAPCCFVASLIDGFVAARAALHHSVNYRSVVIYGEAEDVTDAIEKLAALRGLIERFYPGRWAQIRQPSHGEFTMTRVLRLPILEASAKIRTGFPTPYPEDFGLPVWAGIVPMQVGIGTPMLDPNSAPDTPEPDFSRLREMIRIGGDAPGGG
jgi:hypothetical protein